MSVIKKLYSPKVKIDPKYRIKPISQSEFDLVNGKFFTLGSGTHYVVQVYDNTPNFVRCRDIPVMCKDPNDLDNKGYFEYFLGSNDKIKPTDDKYFLIKKDNKYYLEDFKTHCLFVEISINHTFIETYT